jgi:hypothetical protein
MATVRQTTPVAPVAGPHPSRQFFRRLTCFCSPPALVLLAGVSVLQGSGETWPVERVIAYQRAHPDALFLRATDQAFYAYKYRAVIEKNPSILVAGSSRTMKFRAPMFGDQANAFYNAGGILNSARDVDDFSMVLPESRTPRVLLLGVDLWWLNEGVPEVFDLRAEISNADGGFDEHVVGLRWLVRHPRTFVNEAASLIGGRAERAVGISAREKGGGFRADGSFKSPLPAPRSVSGWRFVDRETPPVIERVKDAVGNFPPAAGLSRRRLTVLDNALGRYQARGVFVIGYFPPFSSEVAAQLASDPRHSRFWSEFRGSVPDVFRRHGFPVMDASEAASVSMDDRAMSDGFHAEETFHLRVLKALMRDDRVREMFPGAEPVLDRALASPKTNYWEADLRN